MELKAGTYATMKDGRTIYITEVMDSGKEFVGQEISTVGAPEVTASIGAIDHIAKCKATMHKA